MLFFMQSCIICKVRQKNIILDCTKLQKNIFRILKLLHQIGLLSLQQPAIPQLPKNTKNKNKQSNDIHTHHHCLITNQAVQLIWRSALLSSENGLPSMLIQNISKNRLIGQNNQLQHIINTLTHKVQVLTRHLGKQHPSVISTRQKLQKLKQLAQKVTHKWKQIEHKHNKNINQRPQIDLLSLFGTNIPAKQAEHIIKQAKRQLFSLDIKILRKSIMFIQQVETGHCIVSLEQCYPSFMVYKELFKSIIGQQSYNQALKQLLLAKESSYSIRKRFRPDDFLMCHYCGKIQNKIDHQANNITKKDANQDSNNNDFGQICSNFPQPANVYSLSYAFQQIFLKSNYSCLPLEPLTQRQQSQCYQLCRNYKRYLHPYAETFIQQCNRFYCKDCLHKTLISEAKDEINQNKLCAYCQRRCTCERCLNLERFNKLLALYHSLGGNFEDVSSELMFLNFCSNRVHMQLVTFEHPNLQPQQGFQQQQRQQSKLNLQQYSKNVDRIKQKEISFIQKITELEQLFQNGSKVRSSFQQSQTDKIYPQVQNLFNKLLKEEQSSGGQSPERSSNGSQLNNLEIESKE